MASLINGIGSFTTDNIVSILRALPETNGTYAQVIARAAEHGALLSPTTLGKWIAAGRADIEAGRSQTAYARFTKRYARSWNNTAVPTPTAAERSTARSRSWSAPANAATTR